MTSAKIKSQVQPFFENGETVNAAFAGQTGLNPMWAVASSLIYVCTVRRRVVVTTNKAVYLCKPAIMRTYKVRKIVSHHPLGTSVTRRGNSMWAHVSLGGVKLWTHKKEDSNIRSVDAMSKRGKEQLAEELENAPAA